jgi:hypothetical protein
MSNLTPKEKAKELYDKFYFVNSESVELITGEYEMLFSLHESDAKQCTLICVDEMISIAPWGCADIGEEEEGEKEFYIEVKKELEKL